MPRSMDPGNVLFKAILRAASCLSCLIGAPAAAAPGAGQVEVVMLYREDIVKVRDLDFGNIIPQAGGVVQIDAQTQARTVISGNPLLAGGTVTAGRFDASATPNRTVTLSINPSPNITLSRVGGADTMRISRIRVSINGAAETPIGPNYNSGSTGIAVIRVGGRLTVGANQAEGLYQGAFSMTWNYQ